MRTSCRSSTSKRQRCWVVVPRFSISPSSIHPLETPPPATPRKAEVSTKWAWVSSIVDSSDPQEDRARAKRVIAVKFFIFVSVLNFIAFESGRGR